MSTLIKHLDGGWDRAVHQEEVWGTVVTFDIRDEHLDECALEVIADGVEFLHQVDRWFSTYRIDTPITALRMGFAELSQMPAIVREVLNRCELVKALTGGVFDPWAVDGGVDPSGFVKGWAADVVADMVVSQGFMNVAINAAGDVSCRGEQSEGQPWVIGIRHPEETHTIIATTEVVDGAIATSGEYERGKHIINPMTGTRDMALRSATVVGPDGGMADALATALLIAGLPGVAWFAQLPGWSGYLVEGENAHFFGPAFGPAETFERSTASEQELAAC